MKKNQYPKSIENFKDDPLFYEELAILKAQEKIAELMVNSNTKRTQLAKLLKQSKAHVTELLSEGRNLTLRTFARVCFHLGMEVDFKPRQIGSEYNADAYNVHNDKNTPPLKTTKNTFTIQSFYHSNITYAKPNKDMSGWEHLKDSFRSPLKRQNLYPIDDKKIPDFAA